MSEIDLGKVNLRTIEEFVIKVGEPVDVAACHPAGAALPSILIIGGDATATFQTVALVQRNAAPNGSVKSSKSILE
jgi:hypothetical protein